MEKQAVLKIVDQLLIIQERDRQIAQDQRELQSLPVRKKETENWITAARQALDQARETLKARQAATKQLELEIESHRQQIAKLRVQQFQIKSNAEYRALNSEIAHLQEKISGLEDQAIAAMEQAEQAQADVVLKKNGAEKDEVRIRDQLQNLELRRGNLEQEIQHTRLERDALAGGIDPAWLARYCHILEHKKDKALVPIENGACGQCHMTLPPQVIHDTQRADGIVTCSFCGRILYLTR